MKEKNEGITLIALIITIIIMLILVGISIQLAINSDIFYTAAETGKKWTEADKNLENDVLDYINNILEEYNTVKLKKVSGSIGIDEADNLLKLGTWENLKPGVKFKAISSERENSRFSLALDEEGNIWSWGENGSGQLGDGTTTSKTTPEKLEIPEVKFKAISAGNSHCLALDEEGNIWSWGYNSSGQLGDGATTKKTTPEKLEIPGATFKAISAGESHCLALDEEGNVWSWGENRYGQLGDGTTTNKTTPEKLEILGATFKAISAGSRYSYASIAIDEEGNIWSWGENDYGQLGDGTTTNKTTPEKLEIPGTTFKAISAGNEYCIALDEQGNIWSWGDNFSGQLGNGIYGSQYVPKKIENMGTTFKEISESNAISTNGILYIPGGNIFKIAEGIKIQKVCSINGVMCIIDENGSIWSMGAINMNQIGFCKIDTEVLLEKAFELQNGILIVIDNNNDVYLMNETAFQKLGNLANLGEIMKLDDEGKLYITEDGTNWIELTKHTGSTENTAIVGEGGGIILWKDKSNDILYYDSTTETYLKVSDLEAMQGENINDEESNNLSNGIAGFRKFDQKINIKFVKRYQGMRANQDIFIDKDNNIYFVEHPM